MEMMDDAGELSRQLRSIVESSEDLMFIKNMDFVYVAVSQAFAYNLFGLSSKEVVGHTDLELFKGASLSKKYRGQDELLVGSDKDEMEFDEEYVDVEGIHHVCRTAKYVLRDAKGRPSFLLGQCHEKEYARKRLRNATNALSRSFFVSNYVDLKSNTFTTLWAKDYVRDMMKGCTTADEGFERFFNTLVRPKHQERVRAFCRMDTLPKRLKGKNSIACEYLSNVASGWCRISFYPAALNEKKEVTQVLFTVSPVDEEQAHFIEEGQESQRELKAIFDEVPGGIVLYRYDAQGLRVLKMSRYYKDLYGYSMVNDSRKPDFQRIHPDDVQAYQEAVQKALCVTHKLEYVFRVFDPKRDRYGWVQINAISKKQEDGSSLVYAMYTDVTDRKIAEIRLKKSRASILAALGAAEQYSYEYDPVLHTSTCFANELNGYHPEPVLRDYPESFRKGGFIHPDDVELFIDTVHQFDAGADSAHCTIRALLDGKCHWHSCTFDAFFDSEKNYRVALLTVVDVTDSVRARQAYEGRIRSLLNGQENMLCMGTFNLASNSYELVHCEGEIKKFMSGCSTFETAWSRLGDQIVDEKERLLMKEKFKSKNLLEQIRQGRMHAQQEVLLRFSEKHYEWVDLAVDLVKNPLTDEVTGVAFIKSAQAKHMEKELLALALKNDYVFVAIVFKDTDEYYIYSASEEDFKMRRTNFWEKALETRDPYVDKDTYEYMKKVLRKEYMLNVLKEQGEFSYVFDSKAFGATSRLEVKFRYLDEKQTSLVVTVREITDQSLLEQWHYDSEHDGLTGLLNRKTVFAQSQKLLEMHKDRQYLLMHCDVRHFHLYNTFFSEEEGDRLLCRISEVLKDMGKAYSDFVCGRIESDVFCAFFPLDHVKFKQQVRRLFEGLESFSPDFPLDLRVGVVLVEDASMSMEAMFSRATIAAKSDVHNLYGLVSRYDETMEKQLRTTQQITSEMTGALEKEQFEVYLQPKVRLGSEEVVGAEALVRWNHPERGRISPGDFIPVFEKNGFITKLDRYMWEKVCILLAKWQREGRASLPVSVNISRVSMYSHATVPFLKSLVEKYGLDPKMLELELTETAYMDDPQDLKRMLRELQEYGFKILMDDFGSGYSSLNTLRELPVDILKLDMKFLSESMKDVRGNAVLSSIVRMSRALDLPIVAEGVEDRIQADILCELGCTYAQGYLFARPMPVREYEELLKHLEMVDGHGEALPVSNLQPDTSFGSLEYTRDHHATIEVSERFLKQMQKNDVKTMELFVQHLDEKSQDLLLRAVDHCVRTKGESMLFFNWANKDGTYAQYQSLVSYVGHDGKTARVSLSPIDITYMNVFGEVPVRAKRLKSQRNIEDFMRTSARLFDRIYTVDLGKGSYTCTVKATDGTDQVLQSASSLDFFAKSKDRFYNPLNKHLLNYLFEPEHLRELLKDREDYYVECQDKEQPGRTFAVLILCVKRTRGVVDAVIYGVRDISDSKTFEQEAQGLLLEDNQRLKELANKDALTGLYNRRGLMELVSTQITSDTKLAMLLIDVDEFKNVNDEYGHAAGDQLLIRVAALLRDAFRSSDVFVRMGGDEFMVLLNDCTKECGGFIPKKIREINEKLAHPDAGAPLGSISVGVAFSRKDETQGLFDRADTALYFVKNHGKNGCCIYEEEFNA